MRAMKNDVLTQIEQFQRETGLSDHRVGIILARNGRLLERLRDPKRRIWPDTVDAIKDALKAESAARGIDLQNTEGAA